MPKSDSAPRRGHNARRRPVLVLAMVALAMLLAAGCASSPAKKKVAASTPVTTPSTSAKPTASSGAPDPGAKTITVSSTEGDGDTYGIGMPIVLQFSPAPTDITYFNKVVKVTVNGAPATGAWYWEQPYAGEPLEAHYREQSYWPAHAVIKVELPIGGLYAGKGLKFGGALTSVTFNTGDAHISTVTNNGATGTQGATMTVTSNGETVNSFPASLGKSSTPTFNGIKIVQQKGEDAPGSSTLRPDGGVRMRGPGYDKIIDWSVKITTSGEYVHAAPWNTHLGQLNTSDGCTNLSVAAAQWFYNFSLIGDVVTYSGSTGTKLPVGNGYGDWNVTWGLWTQGGPDLPASS